MRVWLLCVAASGCHLAFGIDEIGSRATIDAATDASAAVDAPSPPPVDLDMDGIPDDQDPCIAPTSDATADSDGDGVPNASDHCPLLAGELPTDADGDGLDNACDPHPNLPDVLRCVMAFTSTNLNDRLWQPVTSLPPFAHLPGKLHCDLGATCATVAAESVEPANSVTTYEVRIQLSTLSEVGGVTIWPRLDPAVATGSIGCAYINDVGQYYVALLNGDVTVQRKATQAFVVPPLFLRTSISAGTPATVTCNASFDGTYPPATEITGVLASGTGHLGFSTANWATDLVGLEIIQTP